MTSPRTFRSTTLALTCAVALLGLAGCSGSESESGDSVPPLAAEEETASATPDADDPVVATPDDTAADTADDTAATTDAAAGGTATGDRLQVSAEGQGPTLLRLTAGADQIESLGSAETLSGKLISGPGGCFALQPGGQPELLVVGRDAELATQPPTLGVQGVEVKVGEELEVQATAVHLADLDGVPQQCTNGVADTAWVVSER